MTQTLNEREDPLNLGGGGWSSSAPFRTWSSWHRRRSGAPTHKRWHRSHPSAAYEPRRKQPKQQHGQGPWFQPPRSPYWAVHANRRPWGGPWRPPRAGCWKPPRRMRVIRESGLYPLCLCCCFCWLGPWNPGWARRHGRKKRWDHRGRGPPRHPRRSCPRSPPVDLSTLLRPVNLYGWRAPGMRAPRNTTQFIMNQVYEDMRQQEKQERQQEALHAQQAQEAGSSSGNDTQPSGGAAEAEPPEFLFSRVHNLSFGFSPDPEVDKQCSFPQLMEEEEKNDECDQEKRDGKKEESEEEDEEAEAQDEEEEEEPGSGKEEEEEEEIEEEEEGLEEDEQREEENDLPLAIPLSFLVDEEGENLMNCSYLSPNQITPEVPQKALFMDINF